ncbi:hypothetical protein ACWEPL_58255 [Nonomuraea sp. NPDC004186]
MLRLRTRGEADHGRADVVLAEHRAELHRGEPGLHRMLRTHPTLEHALADATPAA